MTDRHPSQRSNDAPSTGANPALIRTQRPGGASAPALPDAGQNQTRNSAPNDGREPPSIASETEGAS
jgi:hypothetical protein